MRTRIALILGIALGALAGGDPKPAAAADRRAQMMQFELVREGPAEICGSSCGAWVSAIGVITADTPRHFELFAERHDIRGAVIALDSGGGSVHGGLLLGRAIRQLAMITTVGKTVDLPPQSDGGKRAMLSPWAACESMCAFVLLAGIERHVPAEARILVHDIWPGNRRNDPTGATYSADELAIVQRDVVQLARYTVEMGGAFALLEVALNVPPWEPMHQLSREELRAMNMATIVGLPSEPASGLARQATPVMVPATAPSPSMLPSAESAGGNGSLAPSDQAERFGARSLDLMLHRRSAWRATVGKRLQAPRYNNLSSEIPIDGALCANRSALAGRCVREGTP